MKKIILLTIGVAVALCVIMAAPPVILGPIRAPNPLIGHSAHQIQDTPEAYTLLRTIPATYVRMTVNYDYWTNGKPGYAGTGPELYDGIYSLNSNYMILLSFDELPTNAIASFIPEIAARYPHWALQPCNEEVTVQDYIDRINLTRAAMPTARIAGPSVQNSFSPAIFASLVSAGAFAKLDVIDMHDYYACVGNGSAPAQPWSGLPYAHPTDAVDGSTPNLVGRITWMRTNIVNLRQVLTDGPRIIFGEYGIYVNNPNDAIAAARISQSEQVPFILSTPNSPAYQSNSVPYGNGVFTTVDSVAVANWTEAMKAYLRTMDPDANVANFNSRK